MLDFVSNKIFHSICIDENISGIKKSALTYQRTVPYEQAFIWYQKLVIIVLFWCFYAAQMWCNLWNVFQIYVYSHVVKDELLCVYDFHHCSFSRGNDTVLGEACEHLELFSVDDCQEMQLAFCIEKVTVSTCVP